MAILKSVGSKTASINLLNYESPNEAWLNTKINLGIGDSCFAKGSGQYLNKYEIELLIKEIKLILQNKLKKYQSHFLKHIIIHNAWFN